MIFCNNCFLDTEIRNRIKSHANEEIAQFVEKVIVLFIIQKQMII